MTESQQPHECDPDYPCLPNERLCRNYRPSEKTTLTLTQPREDAAQLETALSEGLFPGGQEHIDA